MARYLVTVKLPRNPNHNPRAKVTGDCPVSGLPCTDVTGEHHTVLAESAGELAALLGRYDHVTRVEDV